MSLLIKKILEKVKNIDNVKADKINVTTGTEYETGRLINGKKEYGYYYNGFGALPNNTAKAINTGLSTSNTYTKITGIAIKNDGTDYRPIPNQNIKIYFENGWINIATSEDLSAYKAIFEIYYTKN